MTCITRSKSLPESSSSDDSTSEATNSCGSSDANSDDSANSEGDDSGNGSDYSADPAADNSGNEGGRLLTESSGQKYYVGQMGLHRYYFRDTKHMKNHNWLAFIPIEGRLTEKMLWTIPEIAHDEPRFSRFYGFTSYFKAPENGEYRFLMSCDDRCSLYLSTSEPRQPEAKELILYRHKHTSWRNIPLLDKEESSPNFGVVFSKWIRLQKDEYYYFETSVLDGGGLCHLTIGMEIRPDIMPAYHPKADR